MATSVDRTALPSPPAPAAELPSTSPSPISPAPPPPDPIPIMTMRRPPKPVNVQTSIGSSSRRIATDAWLVPPSQVAGRASSSSTTTTTTAPTRPPAMDSSETSRDRLRLELQSRRASLTPQETWFLEQLLVEGNEIEVQIAHETLRNQDLFFEPATRRYSDHSSTSNANPNADQPNQVLAGQTLAPALPTDLLTSDGPLDVIPSLPGSSSRDSLTGSGRRLELLEQRRQDPVHGKIWKAHANGFPLTKTASRRSLLCRQASIGNTNASSSSFIAMVGNSSRRETYNTFADSISSLGGPSRRDWFYDDAAADGSRLSTSANTVTGRGDRNAPRSAADASDTTTDDAFNSSMPALSLGGRRTSLWSQRTGQFMLSKSLAINQAASRRDLFVRQSSSRLGAFSEGSSARRLSYATQKSTNTKQLWASPSSRATALAHQNTMAFLASSRRTSHSAPLPPRGRPSDAVRLTSDSSTNANAGGGVPYPAMVMGSATTGALRSAMFRRRHTFAASSPVHADAALAAKVAAAELSERHSQITGDDNDNDDLARASSAMLLDDIKSDNNRRVSFHSQRTMPDQATMPPMALPPSRPMNRRGSDSSRKSVTFRDIDAAAALTNADSLESASTFGSKHDEENNGSGEHGKLVKDVGADKRRWPMLRSGGKPPINSETASSTATLLSFPSLHLAHSIRSQSFRSNSGDWEAMISLQEGRDPSESAEEKKSDMALAWEDSVDPKSLLLIDREQQRPQQQGISAHEGVSLFDDDDADLDMDDDDRSNEFIMPTTDQLLRQAAKFSRPVLMRDASQRFYEEEGIEIADWDVEREVLDTSSPFRASSGSTSDAFRSSQRMDSLISFAPGDAMDASLRTSNSFDETMSFNRISSIFRSKASIPRTFSEDDMAGIFLGGSRLLLRESSSLRGALPGEDDSWNIDAVTQDVADMDYFDTWKVMSDDYDDMGGGPLSFQILGTSADDVDSSPHVLSPPLMESLQNFLPYSKVGENYWMKFSLVRDGASMHTFLQHARGAKYSFLALETVDGEVFGAFTAEPWRKNWNYFGNGESFLWRMRHSRQKKCHSMIDQAQQESEIDVYPFTGVNYHIQLCTHDKVAIGGGGSGDPSSSEEDTQLLQDLMGGLDCKPHEWGFGLSIESNMLYGTSSPCVTFASPSLSKVHSNGSPFEIMNLELWTLTPCMVEEEAEKLELGRLFLENHRC